MNKLLFSFLTVLLFSSGLAQNTRLETKLVQTQTLTDKVFKGFDGLGNEYFVKKQRVHQAKRNRIVGIQKRSFG